MYTVDLSKYAANLANGGVHVKFDPKVNLIAIVAIDSTALGPALGGCRLVKYNNIDEAINDAVRLAKGMSYKAALSGVATGGGKAVLMEPDTISDRVAYFKSFAKFVQQFGGQYITAMDSGTSLEDMDIISKTTDYVASYTAGDPSPYTAIGVKKGIDAAVKFKFNTNDLSGLTVAIQGLGHVGMILAKLLYEAGVNLIVSDINADKVNDCVANFNAKAVDNKEIYQASCDIFAPCALGAVLNSDTINKLSAKIVAGAANNQLSSTAMGQLLRDKDICYAPDYVINSGGLIYAYTLYQKIASDHVLKKIDNIYSSLQKIFELSKQENLPTNIIADTVAQQILAEQENK